MQREFRLRRKEDFARLRREGRTYHSRWLTLSLMANSLGHNRYGFITSKQVGSAVQRNRVRRLLREIVRQMHPEQGFDVVFITRPEIVGQPFLMLDHAVKDLLRRAGLIEGDLS